MWLYLVRHGIAIDRDDPACPDEAARFLTEPGIAKMREAARGIRQLGPETAVFLTSPWKRALQTAEIVAAEWGISARAIRKTVTLLPDAEPEDFFAQLRRRDEAHVLAFGHAPNVDCVIAYALGTEAPVTAMKKGGLAVLDLNAIGPGRATLQGFYPPKALRRLGAMKIK